MFGRLEVNKNLALHQVEHWDGVESERILSERETELKKEAKETYQKWVLLEECGLVPALLKIALIDLTSYFHPFI